MHKILYKLAMMQISMGLCLLQYLLLKAQQAKTSADSLTHLVLGTPVGILSIIPQQSEPLPTPSAVPPYTEDIKRLMTLLTWHGSITQEMSKRGLKSLQPTKNELKPLIN